MIFIWKTVGVRGLIVVVDDILGLLVLRPSISSLLQTAAAYFVTKRDGLLL